MEVLEVKTLYRMERFILGMTGAISVHDNIKLTVDMQLYSIFLYHFPVPYYLAGKKNL